MIINTMQKIDLNKVTKGGLVREIKNRIGFLRQWLNEKSDDKLVTNEDIEYWLGLSDINEKK